MSTGASAGRDRAIAPALLLADSVSTDPLSLIQTGGVVGLLLVILLGGYRGWWVFGWQYRVIERERDEWKSLALRSTNLVESLSELQPGRRASS